MEIAQWACHVIVGTNWEEITICLHLRIASRLVIFSIEPSSIERGICCARGHQLSIPLIEIRIQWVTIETKLIKNTISKFRPFFDKQFGRITKRFPCVVPCGEKCKGQRNVVTRFTATSTLLGVWPGTVNWMVVFHEQLWVPGNIYI